MSRRVSGRGCELLEMLMGHTGSWQKDLVILRIRGLIECI